MKVPEENESDQTLVQALREWKVTEPLTPGFREQVWRRIERAEAQISIPAWLQTLNQLGQALTRPSLAASYITLLVLAGLLAGFFQARIEKAQMLERLSDRYVQVMDPSQTH